MNNQASIAQEEIFGPGLSVIKYKTTEDAIRIANDSAYGLGGGVWSSDKDDALSIARELRAGTVRINEWHLLSEKAPFGGIQTKRHRARVRHGWVERICRDEACAHRRGRSAGKKFWHDVLVPKD